jgi:DnaJ domain
MILLVAQTFIINPLVQWIVSPSRKWSKTVGFFIAAAVLGTVAIIEVQRYDLNHYEILELPKSATKSEITKAYRKASLTYHPDKATSPEDGLHFLKIQAAYEALSDEGKRSHYEKFGPSNDPQAPDSVQLLTTLVTYFAKFVLVGFLTGGAELAMARSWLFNFLLAAFAAELLLTRFGETDLLSFVPFLGNWPVFQQVWLIGSLFPVMLSSCICLSRETYSDSDATLMMTVNGVVESTKTVIGFVRGENPEKLASACDKIDEAIRRPKLRSNKWGFLTTALSWLFWAFLAKNVVGFIRSSW